MTPSLRVLDPRDYRVMPWRNGLGTTTEIAVAPPGAALDEFVWRVSVAEIGASGPFSAFPGYDRVLMQLEGAPMMLSHDGGGEHRLALLEPYRFAGELATRCTLDAPPARDFNVMVRRDVARAEVVVRTFEKGAWGRAEATLVYVLRGSLSVEVDGRHHAVAVAETLVATNVTPMVVKATATTTVSLFVAIGVPV
jgi:environmental stress-induced protein Ves